MYKFKNKKIGEILEYDEGISGEPGYAHYHRPNPNSKDKVEICIKWTDFSPKPRKSDFSVLSLGLKIKNNISILFVKS